jgi:hypothetical protein
LISGSTLGDIENILTSRRLTDVIAEVDSDLFVMSSDTFKTIKNKFGEYWTELLELASEKK